MSAIPSLPHPGDAETAPRARALRVLAWPIDPANPYTASLYSEMGAQVRADEYAPAKLVHRYAIWHIHWPESLLNIRRPALAAFKLRVFLAMIDLVRLRGGRIVWTVHNLKAHDALHPRLEAGFWRQFIPRVDGVISLSKTGLAMARERFPRLRQLPAAVIPHGHYREQYPKCETDARATLGLPANARTILFFGELRAYKNADALVRAFREVRSTNARLLIAGRANNAPLAAAVEREAAADPRVRLELNFIPREQVAKYFKAADLVVLPYRHILNSGAALLALSFNRPVLVPDLGSMGDLREDFGPEWVRTFGGDIDAHTLEQALDWATESRSPICPMPERYRWANIRAETVRFYKQIAGR
jgi:beta-1,4-mannosyltransferase